MRHRQTHIEQVRLQRFSDGREISLEKVVDVVLGWYWRDAPFRRGGAAPTKSTKPTGTLWPHVGAPTSARSFGFVPAGKPVPPRESAALQKHKSLPVLHGLMWERRPRREALGWYWRDSPFRRGGAAPTKAPKHQSTKAYRRSLPHVGAPTSARIRQAGVESVLEFSEPLQEGFFILHDEAQLVGLGQLRTRARPRDHNTGLGRDGT